MNNKIAPQLTNNSSISVQFSRLEKAFKHWLLIEDPFLIRILVASVIANMIEGDPFWLFLVAPSGGSKTELLRSLESLDIVYFISDLTAQTFASGYGRKNNESLLYHLEAEKKSILIIKDFTTVLSMHSDKKMAILAQLREIFDGRYDKTFGNGVQVSWDGKMGLLAGVTTVIDKHYSIFNNLGERFLQYRIQQPDREEMAKQAMQNSGLEGQMREELYTAMKIFFDHLKIDNAISIDHIYEDKVMHLAELLVHSRAMIERDSYTRQIESLPDIEMPTRATKQLIQLLKALAVLNDGKITNREMLILYRVVLSSMTKIKSLILDKLMMSRNGCELVKITLYTKHPETLVRRAIEDFKYSEVIEDITTGKENAYKLSDNFIDILDDFETLKGGDANG